MPDPALCTLWGRLAIADKLLGIDQPLLQRFDDRVRLVQRP